MKVHCLFEQSGTFKNEFNKLGITAFDYDIENDFFQTDFKIDLFQEIQCAFNNEPCTLDSITEDDIVLAFFPCTRFEACIPLGFRGEQHQQKNWTDEEKLTYSIKLHKELHNLYDILSKLCIVAIKRNWKLIIENPYTQPHYLTSYFPIRPKLIDKDRTKLGDIFKKPTQYFFINCDPAFNNYEPDLQYVETKTIEHVKAEDGKSVQVIRSMITPQYAHNFIMKYIISEEELLCMKTS